MTKEEIEIHFLLWVNAFHPEFIYYFLDWWEEEPIDDYLSRHSPEDFVTGTAFRMFCPADARTYWERMHGEWAMELLVIHANNANNEANRSD